MSSFTPHTIDTAPDASKPLLQMATDKYGFTPNLLGVLAESPAVLETYMGLSQTLGTKTLFSPTELQVVLLAASFENGCTYCMAAHSTAAQGAQVPADVIESLRAGGVIADPKLNALANFTRAVVQQGGWLDDELTQNFRDAGYTNQHILEVILGVALKTISNYTNHFAHTPVDPGFAANEWTAAHV